MLGDRLTVLVPPLLLTSLDVRTEAKDIREIFGHWSSVPMLRWVGSDNKLYL